jgi:hypothetical protein
MPPKNTNIILQRNIASSHPKLQPAPTCKVKILNPSRLHLELLLPASGGSSTTGLPAHRVRQEQLDHVLVRHTPVLDDSSWRNLSRDGNPMLPLMDSSHWRPSFGRRPRESCVLFVMAAPSCSTFDVVGGRSSSCAGESTIR